MDITILAFAWNQFAYIFMQWIDLFLAPIKDPNMLWILFPVYLNWFFTEFYQEKKGTTFGNAISNAFIAVWAGFDWCRTIVSTTKTGVPAQHFELKLGIAGVMLLYGAYIMLQCIKARKNIILLGRIRVVTYVVLMLTPLFYGVVSLSFQIIFIMLLFFPLYYFIIEFIDWLVPDPKSLLEDNKTGEEDETVQQKQIPPTVPPLRYQPRTPYYPGNIPIQRNPYVRR